jgi:hypothetical protein
MPTECRAFPNFKFFYRVAKKICGEAERKNGGHFLSNLPLLEGNMLYLISILVVEYLDCQYRWKFRTSSPNLMRYFDIKFVLSLCTWFALWAIFELY